MDSDHGGLRMLRHVLERLEATEVDGAFHLGWIPGQPSRRDIDGDGKPRALCSDCGLQSQLAKDRRINAACQRMKRLERLVRLNLEFVEQAGRSSGIALRKRRGQP